MDVLYFAICTTGVAYEAEVDRYIRRLRFTPEVER